MRDNIEKLYRAENLEEYRPVINTFERIAQKEQDRWEPFYYAAYGYIMMSLEVNAINDKDRYLDMALGNVKKGLQLAPAEDEFVSMEGFVHMMRVSADPASRGQQYTPLAMQSLNRAVRINPQNPRAVYLLGQMELGTAKFFGADLSTACARLQEAVGLFEKQRQENPLAPVWGKNQAKIAARECSK